jgi:molybdopterin synthase catalytic subunit
MRSVTGSKDAFQACEFMIDTLKTDAPFWKQEDTSAGTRWVSEMEDGET